MNLKNLWWDTSQATQPVVESETSAFGVEVEEDDLLTRTDSRHSKRERRAPKKFQYDEIGKPVVREIKVHPKINQKTVSIGMYSVVQQPKQNFLNPYEQPKQSFLNPYAAPYSQAVVNPSIVPYHHPLPVVIPKHHDTLEWISQYQIQQVCYVPSKYYTMT